MSKVAFVLGGSGQLGSGVVDRFIALGWSCISADFRASPQATQSIVFPAGTTASDQYNLIKSSLSGHVDAVVCAAGGFEMESIGSPDVFAHLDKLIDFNIKSALLASHVASRHLNKDGLLVLTGAKAALGPTAWAIAYGMTKAATHNLVQSLAVETKDMPEGATVLAILPITIDTATNRRDMPGADTSTWTPIPVIGDRIAHWASEKASRPTTGSMIQIATKAGETTFEKI